MVLAGPGTDSLMDKSRCFCNVKNKTLNRRIFLKEISAVSWQDVVKATLLVNFFEHS